MKFTYFLLREDLDSTEKALASLTPHWKNESVARVSDAVTAEAHPRGLIALCGYHEGDLPEWMSLVDEAGLQIEKYTSVQYSLVLLIEAECRVPNVEKDEPEKVVRRVMAVTTAYGRFAIPPGCVENSFGTDVVLNWSDAASLTELETEIPGVRGKRTHERLHNHGNPHDFNIFDQLYTVLKVGAKVADGDASEDISGGRGARYKSALRLDGVIRICDLLLAQFFARDGRSPEFAELQRVEPVDNPTLTDLIIRGLYKKLMSSESVDFSVAPPPVVDDEAMLELWVKYLPEDKEWQKADLEVGEWSSDYLRRRIRDWAKTPYSFLTARVVTVSKGRPTGIESLKHLISHVTPEVKGYRYVLSDGALHKIAAKMHDRLNNRVAQIASSAFEMPIFDTRIHRTVTQGGVSRISEGAYNDWVCRAHNPQYTNLDRAECRKVIHRSRVEAADIFFDGRLVCVKRNHDGEAVAQLCRQVADAAHCLESYPEYWEFIVSKLKQAYPHDPSTNREKFTFVLCIVTTPKVSSVEQLGLKAKLALAACMREVFGMGYGLEIMFVPYGRQDVAARQA